MSAERLGARRNGMVAVSAILVAVLGAVFWRPLALGIPPSGVIACAAFVVGHVFVPGWFAWRALRRRSSDALVDVGMALSLGGALQMLAVAAAASSGWIEHLGWYPAVALPLALVAGRARNDDFADEHEPARLRTGHWLALAALSIIAGARTETYALALAPGSATKDLLFHAGNAAEYRHHWPLTDPRIALEPLVYHFFAYGMPVGASVVTGIPTDELVLSYLGCVAPVLLGLQLFNVARMLGASAGAGLVAAAVALLHVDLGTVLARGFGADGLGRLFLSHLDSGVYHSPTTAPSLVLTITLLPFVAQCLAAERGFDARPWCACALLAATLSGVKGSVIPVAAAALGLVVVWRVVRERTFDRRAATLGATLALAALPMTLYLVADEGGYARSMFAWDPLNLVRASPFAALVADGAGTSLGVLALLLPLWLVGHLGIASLGLFARLRARESWTASERWSLCFVLVGLVPALLLGAAGLSQLFFVYPAQVVLAWLVAPTLTRRFTARSPMTWIFALWIAASLWAIAIGLPEQWRQERDGNQAAPGAGAECHAVTAWLREHTPNDAVLIVRSGPIVLSVSSERRVFLETSIYSPGRHATRSRHFEPGHAGGEESEVWADRRELEAAALSRPTPAVFASIRERTPGAGPFYVFQSRGADGRNLASAASGLELVHETDSTRIYRVIEH